MVAEGAFATGPLNSYCTVEDVLALLSAYDVDNWGGQTALSERIYQLLPPTRQAVDTQAGRDFFYHEDEEIAVDGSGARGLSLCEAGIYPPVVIFSVTISGTLLDGSEWGYYPSANSLKLLPTASVQSFVAGVHNIVIHLDWGYESPPGDIAMAQAKLVAAQLISELSAESQAVQALSIGDYTVRYGTEGRYGADIARLISSAKQTIAKYRAMKMVSI